MPTLTLYEVDAGAAAGLPVIALAGVVKQTVPFTTTATSAATTKRLVGAKADAACAIRVRADQTGVAESTDYPIKADDDPVFFDVPVGYYFQVIAL